MIKESYYYYCTAWWCHAVAASFWYTAFRYHYSYSTITAPFPSPFVAAIYKPSLLYLDYLTLPFSPPVMFLAIVSVCRCSIVPSVLWRCWLGGRKGIRPVKKLEWWGAGVVIWLERGADLHMAQLMPLPLIVSCFSKSQIGFTFLVPAHLGRPGKRAVKWVCVYIRVILCGLEACPPIESDLQSMDFLISLNGYY